MFSSKTESKGTSITNLAKTILALNLQNEFQKKLLTIDQNENDYSLTLQINHPDNPKLLDIPRRPNDDYKKHVLHCRLKYDEEIEKLKADYLQKADVVGLNNGSNGNTGGCVEFETFGSEIELFKGTKARVKFLRYVIVNPSTMPQELFDKFVCDPKELEETEALIRKSLATGSIPRFT